MSDRLIYAWVHGVPAPTSHRFRDEQIAAIKSIRKPLPPPTVIIRPAKGRGYRRPQNKKEIYGEN